MSSVTRAFQRWLRPLERTPLHPQWLVLRHRRALTAWVRLHAHGTLVDVGCGNGGLRNELPPDVYYVGLDYPETVALGYAGAADIFGDASDLPIASGSADVVTLLDVLEHLPDPGRAVSEAARVLRSGGMCLVHVPFLYPLHDEPHDYQRWTRHGLQRLFASRGFSVREMRETTSPLEAAAALLAMALAGGLAGAIQRRSGAFVLAPLVVVLVPLVNVLGWTLGRLLPASPFMSFGYCVLVQKCPPERSASVSDVRSAR